MKEKSILTLICMAITMLNIDFGDLLSDTSAIEEGGSMYGVVGGFKKFSGAGITIVLLVAAFICIFCGVKFCLQVVVHSGNAAKLQAAKENVGWLIGGIIGAAAIVGVVIYIFANGQKVSNQIIESVGISFFNVARFFL